MKTKDNYYIGAISWSVIQKVLSALIGFISTPLLLGYFGKADFGVLAIATSCNGYMQLLDLGMNVGAVRFYSIWLAEGKRETVEHVLRANVLFYSLIAAINVLLLLAIAFWGEPLFSISHAQFQILRTCLYILALFSLFSWLTTAYNQLLVADKQMAYTMKVNCITLLARVALLVCVFLMDLSLTTYFFWLTLIVASLVVPYAIKCMKSKLISNILPAPYWREFKPVILFSFSILALSFFQMSATQTRPIILGMFAVDGASSVTDFSIISVFPNLIIMIGGTFTSVFLPKTSELISTRPHEEQERFTYKWTIFTTIIANCLCFPIILGSEGILSAYVGSSNAYLAPLMNIWIVCTLLQIHSTPANALILGNGKTKVLVIVSAVACAISILVNAILAKTLSTGSAIIGYAIYILINLICNYCYYYSKVLKLSNIKVLASFLKPTLCGVVALIVAHILLNNYTTFHVFASERMNYILAFSVKSVVWLVLFSGLILITRTLRIRGKKLLTKYDL